jgi:hypothetical protein
MGIFMGKILQEVKQNKRVYIGFVVVVFLSAALRLWGLGNNPFVADEFLDVNATQGYSQTGQWQAWDFNNGDVSVRDNRASDERAWIYRWQVAQVLKHLEPTEFNFRLVSALWGILTTLILYLVTFSFTKNRWIALLAAFFWAVSIPAIEMNRKIRMYSMFVPIFLVFSWSLFEFIDSMGSCTGSSCSRKMIWKEILRLRWIYLVPTVIFGALAYHLHPLTGNIIFVLFTYFVVMFVIKRKELVAWRYGTYVVIMLLGTLLIKLFVPSVWHELTSSLVFFDNHWSYVGHIMRNYWHPIIGGMLILVGSWYLIKKQSDQRPGIWVVVTFFVTVISAIFLWNRNVGSQYIFFVQPFGFILVAGGVYALARYLQKNLGSRSVFMIVIILSFVFLPSYYYFFQDNNTYHITSKADSANYRKVFLFVKKNISDGDAMITRNFRNYYYSGLNVPVLDFGSERSEEQIKNEGKVKKITVAEVESFGSDKETLWVVYSDNDEKFITKEARAYFEQNCQKQNDLLVRGKVNVYKCENFN